MTPRSEGLCRTLTSSKRLLPDLRVYAATTSRDFAWSASLMPTRGDDHLF